MHALDTDNSLAQSQFQGKREKVTFLITRLHDEICRKYLDSIKQNPHHVVFQFIPSAKQAKTHIDDSLIIIPEHHFSQGAYLCAFLGLPFFN